jgi:hypothetical protein
MPSDGLLTWDDGLVKLGGELLPGVFVDQRISGAVRFDQSEKDNQSGRHKVPLGFEDADIQITLDLLCDESGDCYAKLAIVNRIFRADRRANPKVYAVSNRHCAARGINNVVFSGLASFESDLDDVITVSLAFVEHLPAVIKREKQQAAAKKAATATGTAPAVKATPAESPAIVADPNPFMAGLLAGSN